MYKCYNFWCNNIYHVPIYYLWKDGIFLMILESWKALKNYSILFWLFGVVLNSMKTWYFNFIFLEFEMKLDLSKHMWNLRFSTQSNDVQEFHIWPKNEIWTKIIWTIYIKKVKIFNKFSTWITSFMDYYGHLCKKNHYFLHLQLF
jgi:hypothetical protein